MTNAQPINEGSYSVLVTNTVGSATSPSALLTVLIRPILSNPMMLPGGGFQMTLSGNTNRTYAVETSTNLNDWAQLTTLLYTNGAMIWKDSTATNSGNRIYRLRLTP